MESYLILNIDYFKVLNKIKSYFGVKTMSQTNYQRFTITVPDSMASQIEQVCRDEGRNRSELFREAFRVYLTHSQTGLSTPQVLTAREDPFRLFWPQGAAQSGQVYDRLATESEKDRLLAQWAQMVETEPGFEDVRAVSDAADGLASEAV
jgi:Arc/MetJ-type ribon-helix-helix transcriptional regulator